MMLTVSTPISYTPQNARNAPPQAETAGPLTPRPSSPPGALRHALLVEAARTIREDGVDAVTLRAVGARLGVSRTALYRHFADKSALLAAVAREGFQRFRQDLRDAWMGAGRGRAGFKAMGMAYVHFA